MIQHRRAWPPPARCTPLMSLYCTECACIAESYSPGRPRGARVDDEGKGGPLGSPAGWGGVVFPQDISERNRYAGDPKGPPFPSSAALAPTDVDDLFLG